MGCRISEAHTLRKRKVWTDERSLVLEIGVLKRRDTRKGPYENVPHLIHVSLNSPFVKEYILPYLEVIQDRDRKLFPRTRQAVWYKLKKLMADISPHVFRHDRLMKLAMRGAT